MIEEVNKMYITMTSSETMSSLHLDLRGTNTAYVDWGDGTPVEMVTPTKEEGSISHDYTDTAVYSIIISGNNIISLIVNVFDAEITLLDVSNNPDLKALKCIAAKLTCLILNKNSQINALIAN